MRYAGITVAALLCCGSAYAQTPSPERKIEGTSVISREPSLRVAVPTHARYVGADRWVLSGVADCEVHVFVEADASRQVQRLYWIQFEAYLPSKPELRYNYDRDPEVTMNGLAVRHRERFGPTDEKPRAGSDLEHVQQLIAAANYTLPREIINARLVHLPDDTRRSEVMVIYIEDMAITGRTSSDFLADGKVSAAWAPVAGELLERAKARITFEKRP